MKNAIFGGKKWEKDGFGNGAELGSLEVEFWRVWGKIGEKLGGLGRKFVNLVENWAKFGLKMGKTWLKNGRNFS